MAEVLAAASDELGIKDKGMGMRGRNRDGMEGGKRGGKDGKSGGKGLGSVDLVVQAVLYLETSC